MTRPNGFPTAVQKSHDSLPSAARRGQRSLFDATIDAFLRTPEEHVVGRLSYFHGFDTNSEQANAWAVEARILRSALSGSKRGHIYFEFLIPRMGRRADVVIYSQGIVFVIEFKVGASKFERHDKEQAHGYALDLKYFHSGSHYLPIIPILVATKAPAAWLDLQWGEEKIAETLCTNGQNLAQIIAECVDQNETIISNSAQEWENTEYYPSPTIVQAAQALYAGHAVEDITKSEADENGLALTSRFVQTVIAKAKSSGSKAICFVTGVPGAGKTLVGLTIATSSAEKASSIQNHAVYLSGNGPLVDVLREALARDESTRNSCTKAQSRRRAETYIQNIHHFRDEYLADLRPPAEKVVIFDEAQRAWDREHTSDFMRRKKHRPDFNHSEPEFLVSVMDRHKDWAVIVALVGGGQEIYNGEAGLAGWLEALSSSYSDWNVYLSPEVEDMRAMGSPVDLSYYEHSPITISPSLHLDTSQRSFRSELISEAIHHLVHGAPQEAKTIFEASSEDFPIFITRDIEAARKWIRNRRKPLESSGLLASSKAHRLLPEGIFVKNSLDPATWFLNDPTDVRSSHALELVGTEFDVQGLELDWTILAWDADYRWNGTQFEHWNFRGSKWQTIRKVTDQEYLRNTYRVLLTRARQGTVIFVPKGSESDPTRKPYWYDSTAEYLFTAGIPSLPTDVP